MLLALSLLLATSACSKYLEVRVFNATEISIRVCSLGDDTDCIRPAPNFGAANMSWKRGVFTVETSGCKRSYNVPGIDALDDYRVSRNDPLQVVVAPDYSVYLLRKGGNPTATRSERQPEGFPVEPSISGQACR
ncbi:hypothetical protein KIH07_02135 [Hydrogenophaga taeniospiralis]|uniref:hypothetical protein n=1 Tax=Hydrogenophaga taeniospiralis TaxID=65656 RepID=UPI001CFB9093|nr:hypothetical protein [Hydrogenophaga taeniospiralis]MCB4362514.1 hypothetical protein [Hydrogenophaga taeniospiralis]